MATSRIKDSEPQLPRSKTSLFMSPVLNLNLIPASVGHRDFKRSFMADNFARPYNRRRMLTINDLPDDDLLAIFDFYVVELQESGFLAFRNYNEKREIESWQTLVHVCRRWRGLVFGSPSRLNLHLCRLIETSERISLDVWPALPLLILGTVCEGSVDNIVAELKYSDRIRQIQLNLNPYALRIDDFWTAMKVPFPELTVLDLSFMVETHETDLFLGGFAAPRLRCLTLSSVSFPGLPTFLLSATHLISLCLSYAPHSGPGYVPPEAMATCLSVLTSLESFQLGFEDPQSSHDRRRSPPPTRSVLPALKKFRFEGTHKYFEDLVSRVDAPRLNQLFTTFSDDSDLVFPELNRFIGRTPRFQTYNEARLTFHQNYDVQVRVRLSHEPRGPPGPSDSVIVEISCHVIDWQALNRLLSSLAQVCTSPLHPLSTIETLYIYESADSPPAWNSDIENADWLGFLLPFTAVKNLYLSKTFATYIAPALQALTGARTTEVLPALQNVLFEESQPWVPLREKGIAQFIFARQLTNYPVTVSAWDTRDSWW